MKVIDCVQGTPEWFAARCGIPSASNFDKIVTTAGIRSKQAEKYMYQLAAERVTRRSEESYTNAAMQRGVEMEADARALYEMLHDVKVEQLGFCLSDSGAYGASPDGLVGSEGGLEIKCPMAYASVGYLLDGKLPTEYFQQVQGNMLVTGRQWWDFMSYYPGLKPLIVRVQRDNAFLNLLERELNLFDEALTTITERIK